MNVKKYDFSRINVLPRVNNPSGYLASNLVLPAV